MSASAVAGTITYRTHFANAGPDRAAGTVTATATATVTLPSQTVSAGVDLAGCTYDNGTKVVTCDLSGMPVGQGVIPVVTAQINPLSLGTLTATAHITGTDPDPDPANNTATASCTALTGLIVIC